MSNPTRYQRWRLPIINGTLGQETPQEPDPDPADPIDYAASTEGAAVQVGISVTEYAELLAGETVTVGNTGGTTVDDPSNANDTTATLGALHFSQTNSERDSFAGFGTVSYFWAVDFGSAVLVERMRVWDPVAAGSPAWITGGWPTTTIEFSDDGSSWTPSSYVLTAASVPTGNIAPYATATTEYTYTLDASSTHRYWRIFKTGSPGGFVLGDAMCSWYIDGATSSGIGWNPAPQANDGDVATSAFSDTTGPTLRVALAVERLIYRIELDVGMETSGASVFELYGADPTFTTTTLLTTLNFTATGSYTLDTVAGSWLADASYQYFQLEHVSGGGADREFYEVRLFSAIGVPGVSDHPSLTGRDTTDSHPADAVTVTPFGSIAATDVQGALEELLAEAGGGALGWFNVEDYGAVHDGSTDDTVAIQDTIDAAGTAGGGVVYFPAGVYVVAGALQDTSRSNSQLLLPRLDYVDTEQVTIELRGAFPPPPIMSVIGSTPVPDGHSILKGTLNTASGTAPSMLGAWGPSGTFDDFTNVLVRIQDLAFRMPSNPQLSALNLSKVAAADIDNVIVDVGSYYVQGLTEPTTSASTAIKLPGNNNGAYTRLGAVNVIGFYTGFEYGEHTQGEQVTAWGCKIGHKFLTATYHASHFDRMMAVHCERVIQATGTHPLVVDELNIEHAASGWWVTDFDVDDGSNLLYGHLAWHVVLAGTGVDSTFTVNGATGLHTIEIGDDPYGGSIDWAETADISTLDYDDVPDGGVLNEAARGDHVHGMPSASAGSAGHYEVIVSGTAPPVAVTNIAEDDWLYGFVPD